VALFEKLLHTLVAVSDTVVVAIVVVVSDRIEDLGLLLVLLARSPVVIAPFFTRILYIFG